MSHQASIADFRGDDPADDREQNYEIGTTDVGTVRASRAISRDHVDSRERVRSATAILGPRPSRASRPSRPPSIAANENTKTHAPARAAAAGGAAVRARCCRMSSKGRFAGRGSQKIAAFSRLIAARAAAEEDGRSLARGPRASSSSSSSWDEERSLGTLTEIFNIPIDVPVIEYSFDPLPPALGIFKRDRSLPGTCDRRFFLNTIESIIEIIGKRYELNI